MPRIVRTSSAGSGPKPSGQLKIERVVAAITKKQFLICYATILISSLAEGFRDYSTSTLQPYATSAFRTHSLLSTAGVLSRIGSVIGPPLAAQLSQLFGRAEILAVLLCFKTIRDIMMAASQNVQTYITANFFNGIGAQGWEILIQIFIADTTLLENRGFWNVVPGAISIIISLYTGSEIGGAILREHGTENGWRIGYGIWAAVIPVCCLPIICMIFYLQHKTRNDKLKAGPVSLPFQSTGIQRDVHVNDNLTVTKVDFDEEQTEAEDNRENEHEQQEQQKQKQKSIVGRVFDILYNELDVIGAILLTAGLTLMFVPLTLGKTYEKWQSGSMIAMITVGCILFVIYLFWDSVPNRFRPKFIPLPRWPIVPIHFVRDLTCIAICVMAMTDFMGYALFQAYLTSYLQVAARQTPVASTRIDNTIRLAFNIAAIVVGLGMKYNPLIFDKIGLKGWKITPRHLIWVGVPMFVLSFGIQIKFVSEPLNSNAIPRFIGAKILSGVGRAMYQTAGQVTIQGRVKRSDVPTATAFFYAIMSVGGAIGTAAAGSIWNENVMGKLNELLPDESQGEARAIFGNINKALSYSADSATGQAVIEAYTYAQRLNAIAACSVAAVMVFCAVVVKDIDIYRIGGRTVDEVERYSKFEDISGKKENPEQEQDQQNPEKKV